MPTSGSPRSLRGELDAMTAGIPEAIGSRIDAGVHEIEASGMPPDSASATARRTSRCPTRWESRSLPRTYW